MSKVELTGNWSADLVSVAESQRAYEESTKNYRVETDEVTGEEIKKGYTRYGAWYNSKYNGDPYGDWSAMFLSFCLEYANIPEEDFPREAATETWRRKLSGDWEGYQDCHFYTEAKDHTPAPGEIVFLDENENQKSDRVVLITELTYDETEETPVLIGFKTIGGDVSLRSYPDAADAVDVEEFQLDDSRILGYAALPENPDKLEDPELAPEQPALTEEEAAQVNDIIARIDALPTLEELREALAAQTQTEPANTEPENIPSSASAMPEAEGEPSVSQKVAQLYSEYCSMTEQQQEAVTNSDKLLSLAEELSLTEEETFCGKTAHTHSETCYDEAGALTCASEAHTHTLACYSDPAADVESEEIWASSVSGAEITGFFRDDLLAVANTQLGYTESAKNYRVLEDGETIKGYTRYGHWYGGMETAYDDWSAMFVSFCLNYAQIPEDTFPRSASPAQWMEQLQIKEGLYAQAGTESPEEGELVFFDRDGDGLADHVGIVSALVRGNAAQEGSEAAAETAAENTASEETATEEAPAASPQLIGFTAIQGDVDGAVAIQDYTLDDAAILGYGKLPKGETVLTSEGADYTITVRYSGLAELPEDTRLVVSEIQPGTEDYMTYASLAAKAMKEEEGQVTRRFFDLTLMSGDQVKEPAARVKVDVSFPDRPVTVEEDTVVHFQEDSAEPEVLTATVDEEGLHYEQETFSVVGFTASSINTSYTYALMSGNYALTVVDGKLTAVATTTPPEAQYVQWQFEPVQNQSGYRIKTAVGDTTFYLNITQNNYIEVTDAANTTNITRFTTTLDTNANPNTVTLRGRYRNDNTYNRYYVTLSNTGVVGTNRNTSTAFSLYYDPDANKVATISPSSTTINLFDYRVNMGNDYDDWKENSAQSYTGINEGHALLFRSSGWGGSAGDGNAYYSGVNQGIVKDQLENGYPVLSDTKGFTGPTDAAMTRGSLDYLFDLNNLSNSDGKVYKRAYSKVKGLLQLDTDGYYYYRSTDNYAEFPVDESGQSTNNNRFNVYDTAAIGSGNFFPFDAYATTSGKGTGSNDLNHYFGLSMTTYFVQNYSGYANSGKTTHTTFEFSGDDDVWIFIDGVLVADLGGIHDAQSVKIDFVTGTVTISNIAYPSGASKTTYFKDIFADTDVALQNYGDGDTLVNNSSHTLNFYYLERGANASNLVLKYNLLEIPATSIYKIDQYGTPLAGAEFAVYGATKQIEADNTVTYLYNGTDAGGASTTVSLKDYTYWDRLGTAPEKPYWYYRGTNDPDKWDILTSDGYTISCKYCGTTDGNGEMIFQDDDGSILSLENMAERFGSHFFILREVDVPDGYRTVSDESWFHIDEDAGVMLCDSTYTSGVWASNNANVTASDTLFAASGYEGVAQEIGFAVATDNSHYSFDDYMTVPPEGVEGTVTMNGTLFAVVLKRNDKTLDQLEEWYPVYGSDIKGYQLVQSDKDSKDLTGINAVINAAQKQEKLTGIGSAAFTPSTLGGGVTAQVVLENLPGKIDRYYTYMQEKIGGGLLGNDSAGVTDTDPQYFVAYYYTSASSIDDATSENTVRVYSRENVISDTGYDPFDIAWGTTIEVPNMENRLFFQKTNGETTADGSLELLDGAVFALYDAYEAPNASQTANIVYYVGKDVDGKTVYVGLYTPGITGYEPNKAIVFSDPADETDGKSHSLGTGFYEIDKNFTVNIIKDETTGLSSATIDPNTGSEPGKITVTIKNDDGTTKAQYFVHPATNAASTPEALVGATHDVCSTVSEKGTGHFTKLKSGKYYLREIKAPEGYAENTTDIPVLVDDNGVYANAGDANNNVAVGNGLGYLSKTLDVFASQNEIDESLTWVYGALIQNNASGFTAFQNVDGDVLTVGDGSSGWMFVTQDASAPSGYGTDTSTSRADAMVTYLEYNSSYLESMTQTTGTQPIFDYTPNADQKARNGITANGEGTYRLWTQEGWSDLAVYQDYAYGHRQNPDTTYYQDLTASGNISNLFSSSTFVQVTDETAIAQIGKEVQEDSNGNWGSTNDASIGDTVWFREIVKAYEGAKEYIVHDLMSDGLSFNGDSLEITVGGTELKKDTDYTLSVPDAKKDDSDTDYTFDITFTETYLNSITTDTYIVIKYSATLNEKAVIGSAGNPNQTKLDYWDPLAGNGGGMTSTIFSETITYTWDLDVLKYADGDEYKVLKGAQFVLLNSNTSKAATIVNGKVTGWVDTPTAGQDGTITWPDNTVLTTDENGKIAIDGLDADVYNLREVKAPDGYNLLTEDKTVTIAGATVKEGETVPTYTTVVAKVDNKSSYKLPETGGPGTVTMAVLGLAMVMIGAFGLVVLKKRGGAM